MSASSSSQRHFRKSIRCRDESILIQRAGSLVELRHSATSVSTSSTDDPNGRAQGVSYETVIAEAHKCVGHGSAEGAFHEEWDAQLLVKCGLSADGSRVVIFCPKFLDPCLGDPDELDTAFRYVLLNMDSVVRREQYVFVYCFLGLDWTDPQLSHMVRFAYDILPKMYAKQLKHFYILHATTAFRMSMWTFWAWLSKRVWSKIVYVDTLEDLCEQIHPNDPSSQAALRRRFPQLVLRSDATWTGREPPVAFGIPIEKLSDEFGVDYMDKTTGRRYQRLPPSLICLCEVMEREGADEDFTGLFGAESERLYSVIDCIDEGRPLGRDIPMQVLWCALKLFLDCLPAPLLSHTAVEQLQQSDITAADQSAHRKLLANLLRHQLLQETAHAAIYLASFLHTLCENAQRKQALCKKEQRKTILTYPLAARAFASAFLRPRRPTRESSEVWPTAVAFTETFLRCAEDPEFWPSKRRARPKSLSLESETSMAASDIDSGSISSTTTSSGGMSPINYILRQLPR